MDEQDIEIVRTQIGASDFAMQAFNRILATIGPYEAARCPDCLGSEFPGWKRGMRCQTCDGSAFLS